MAKGTLIEFGLAPLQLAPLLSPGVPLPSPYFESGYTITSSGGWTGPTGGGYGVEIAGADATGTLQSRQVPGWVSSDTGAFLFNSVFVSGANNFGITYQINWYLNGDSVASFSGGESGYPSYGGEVYGLPDAPIDTLDITVTISGTSSYGTLYVDDINVGVPDSASTVGLRGVALVPLIAMGVRQRRQNPPPE